MRAVVFHRAGELLITEVVPDPTPRLRDVVIQVRRCGICASDLHVTESHADPSLPPLIKPGTVMGHEFAGEVVAVGRDVERLKVGDRVAPMAVAGCGLCQHCLAGEPLWCKHKTMRAGGYSDLALAPEHSCILLPSTVSMEDGALVEPIACGLHAVSVAEMPIGARVMVIGAGPIGLATIFWARRFGAGRIVATARSDRRAAFARAAGATKFLTSGADFSSRVSEALRGPPDVVFECVGASGLVDQAIRCVRPGGTVVIASFCLHPDSVSHAAGMLKQVRLQYSVAYHLREFELTADMLDEGHPELTSIVTDRVSFGAFPQAFEALRGSTSQVKVMLDTSL